MVWFLDLSVSLSFDCTPCLAWSQTAEMFSAAGLLQAGRPKVKRKPTPTSEDEMWIFPGESRIHTHYKYIYLSNLSIHPSIHPPIHPSIHPIYLSIYLATYLSIYLSTYL
jgi:hypothetical protein